MKDTVFCLLLAVAVACPAADAQTEKKPKSQPRENTVIPRPLDDSKVVDNTLDSLNIALTARPVPGSSRKGANPVLFLVGNSTMRTGTQGNGNNGQWGWGYYAGDFFDPEKITVENHALGGLSSRTFYESFWKPVIAAVRPGDWVIIELGHNDNGAYDTGRARASIPGVSRDSILVTIKETGEKRMVYSYGEYMRKFVNETLAKGAYPVLASVTPRNQFNAETKKFNRSTTHGVWAKQIAEETGVPFIDLNNISASKYDVFGPEKVKYMFYLDGIHTSAFGAYVNAQSAAEGIRACPGVKLAEYLKPAQTPYDSPKRKGKNPVLFTVGDSTVKNEDKDENSMWGWGSVIQQLFDTDKITVDNQAMAGRSARTFLDEGRWDKVYEALRPGDFVLIQFGHNDGGPINTKPARGELNGTGEESIVMRMEATGKYQVIYTFGWYLRKFIMDAKEKGAVPVVLSHTPRNQFDENGKIKRNTTTYGIWTKEAARQAGAYYIDLNAISAAKMDKMPKDSITAYFRNDHTHSSLKGALLNAQSIADGLRGSDIPLKAYLKK
ncbi:MAG: rhamnogalacturonan acetylesterase [Prevotella sp.]|jgi:lysophospholipase L1-like esterase|nr:rhamnogalacturonan acetylesterase [Prevotella sp.]